MRNKIFISHATPDDNDFTKWLALKLIGLGYEVWCDILFLDKGADFWSNIEKEIRENTCKFLIVSSSYSNQREGVLKELAVAAKVKKQLRDKTFIIPLAIDENLSYDDINIDIVRLNAIDFKKSWANGLRDLLETLEKQSIPKYSPDPTRSNKLYQQIFLFDKGVIEKEEVYDSNWFSITSFPNELRFHNFDWRLPKRFDVRDLPFPAIRFKNYLCTFAWEYDFMEQLPKTAAYSGSDSIRIPTQDVLFGNYDTDFIRNFECQRLIVQLTNKAFELQMLQNKGLREYEMSNKLAFWFEKGKLEKDKINGTLMVGKQKEKNWHFGISGATKLYPFPVLMVSSHIFFTKDGKSLIESKSIQHSSRRRQGKNWWNDTWRSKLLSFANYLSEGNDTFYLEVGSEEKILISNQPLQFKGKFSYIIPENGTMQEEADLENFNEFENFDEDGYEENTELE
ncbi:TIR domain-containing protein [Flagellimonas taeanensis]|uniref:toll/interleukin-1 receptor domain-containing protein n=1 Tax=Flagellimonas taeanensis TaxID=1005926 RepID=UPI000E6880B8|nr:toll/interleukin-1 receptor domain-containing protein [Allomuricauda taeanensis]RIV51352.1 TIR domain-containing protein [Allomuricauda taeanensis]